jgi:hypothetical protein
MQILEAGGISVLSEKLREPNEDNPLGYFELEAVKKLRTDHSWIGASRGMVVKMVAPLVKGLPPGQRYRIILMERDYGEILDSQAKMIARRAMSRGASVDNTPQRRRRLISEYDRIVQATKQALSARSDVKLLVLRYDKVVRDAADVAR